MTWSFGKQSDRDSECKICLTSVWFWSTWLLVEGFHAQTLLHITPALSLIDIFGLSVASFTVFGSVLCIHHEEVTLRSERVFCWYLKLEEKLIRFYEYFLLCPDVNWDSIKSNANESVQKLQATHPEFKLIYYWHGCEICGGASNIADFWENPSSPKTKTVVV